MTIPSLYSQLLYPKDTLKKNPSLPNFISLKAYPIRILNVTKTCIPIQQVSLLPLKSKDSIRWRVHRPPDDTTLYNSTPIRSFDPSPSTIYCGVSLFPFTSIEKKRINKKDVRSKRKCDTGE